jgi:hypothetical protein
LDGNQFKRGVPIHGWITLVTPCPQRKGFAIEPVLVTISRLAQSTLAPSFHMPPPLCIYFHYPSSLKIVRMPESDPANHVSRLAGYGAFKFIKVTKQ